MLFIPRSNADVGVIQAVKEYVSDINEKTLLIITLTLPQVYWNSIRCNSACSSSAIVLDLAFKNINLRQPVSPSTRSLASAGPVTDFIVNSKYVCKRDFGCVLVGGIYHHIGSFEMVGESRY